MASCWFIVIESMGAFWVDCEGKAYGPFGSREDAVLEARRIAVTYGDDTRRAEVFSADPDGTHRLVWIGPEPTARTG